MRLQFRRNVQVIRGIAVLLVVLFHLGIAGFTSGFLGVDVFFVIGGYLMAVLYDPSKKAEFFAKRARRLLGWKIHISLRILSNHSSICGPSESKSSSTC